VATIAFILIETAVGKTRDVVTALRGVSGVTTVDAVTGPYDVIAVVQAPNLSDVGDVVTGRIHTVNGIVRTVTCLSLSPS
jgi:DNA-binding Lrp family transcriptional regulator